MKWMIWILATMGAAAVAFGAGQAGQDIQLPEGEGKEIVEKTCTVCHSAERIVREHLDAEGWETIIAAMEDEGAEIEDAEYDVLLDYLVKNFGPEKK